MEESSIETVVVGASAAGLAVGACLKQADLPFVLLEQSDRVASIWRRHYDRLHLHTTKGLSGLPFLPMPDGFPRYPSREQIVAYLEGYADKMELSPLFGEKVLSVEREAGIWVTRTEGRTWRSVNVVLATGYTRRPYLPVWPGVNAYAGKLIHSSEYDSGSRFKSRRVLVVGFGNSAGEIAIDLTEQGAQASLSVRGAVNVVPRDLFGIPILGWGLILKMLPMGLADLVSRPLVRASIGDIRDTGLQVLPYGPNTQIRKYGHIPLLDIGTVDLIRQGGIQVRPGIERFTSSGVVFAGGLEESFDAVVMATGYRPALTEFLRQTEGVLDDRGTPVASGQESSSPGLFFCGFHVSPTGMLREIGIEAKKISRLLRRRARVRAAAASPS